MREISLPPSLRVFKIGEREVLLLGGLSLKVWGIEGWKGRVSALEKLGFL
jgi:hypothetical protein